MEVVKNIIAAELGVTEENIKLDISFYEAGGNSANAVSVVVKLRKAGYNRVKIPDLLNAKTIEEFIDNVIGQSQKLDESYIKQAEQRFQMQIMDENSDRSAINNLLAAAFFKNNNIFKAVVTEESLRLFMHTNYNKMTKQGLCRYVVDTHSNSIVACNITIDRSLRLVCTHGFGDIWEVLGVAESFADAVISREGGRWADSYFTAIALGLSSQDGTYLLMKVEELAVDLARMAGFNGIMCCQMHPATGALSDIQIDNGFEEVGQIHLKKHRFSGSRLLFAHLSDNEVSRTIIKRF